MTTRSALAVASVLVSLLAAGNPAGAAPGGDGGLTCGAVAVSQDGSTWSTVIEGGPWVAPDGALLQLTCELQRWTGDTWETVASASSEPTPGVTVVPPTQNVFHTPLDPGSLVTHSHGLALLGVNLQMCTQITVYRDPGAPHVYYDDADGDPSNGAQCEKADRAESDLLMVSIVPPHGGGTPCLWLEDDQMPYEVCI